MVDFSLSWDADCLVMKKIGNPTITEANTNFFLSDCEISYLISRNCLNLKKFSSIWKRMVKNLV